MRTRPLFVSVFVIAGALSCKVALKEPPALPAFPLDGLWIERESFQDPKGEIRLILDVRSSSDKQAPYDFRLLRLTHRDLVVSGKILIYTEISGRILTSRNEAMLRRDALHRGSKVNRNQSKVEIWPVEDYEGELLERHISGGNDLEVLKLSSDGNVLEGGDWVFTRAVPLSADTRSFRALGVVLRAASDGGRARVGHFSEELLKAGGPYEVMRGGKLIGKAKVTAGMIHEATADAAGIQFALGDIIVTSAKAPTQERIPTKEEVMERLKRGEQVPREILIQVLGK